MKLQENGENISDNVNPDFNTDHTEQHRETKPDIQRNNGLVKEEGNTIQVYSSEEKVEKNHCNECGKYFITSYILKMHIMSHTKAGDVLEVGNDDPFNESLEVGVRYQNTFLETNDAVREENDKKVGCVSNNYEVGIVTVKDVLKRIIESENGVRKCKVCGKISSSFAHAREHAEIHIEGLRYPCIECGKSLKTSSAMRQHKKKWHNA